MVLILWICLFALVGFLIHFHRTSIHDMMSYIWSDGVRLLGFTLAALALIAIVLNHHGVHPSSMHGMFVMGLVAILVGAIFLRWGETRR